MRTQARTPEVLRPALEHLVKGIVEHTDDVRVRMVDSRRGARLEIRVHPDDLGTVIGRGGRTARALRTVVGSIGGRGVRVEIVDAY
ncbi:RNA-binding protein [Longispora sp. NPDC051575]|uniref:RNA-binding protein n=1 Tax=Longispora sp. NPDC051575 TaxID=3154943 RepID=UPI0018CA17B6|nr:RNA-binding protein [Longispora fulva]